MIGAFTHSEEGDPKQIFLGRDGKSPLSLPGGHGQNFAVLKETYLALHAEGRRYATSGMSTIWGICPTRPGSP